MATGVDWLFAARHQQINMMEVLQELVLQKVESVHIMAEQLQMTIQVVLQYVRIEFPGIPLTATANSEINGLTLYAVGSGTTIDHIQVSYSGDDSYEWFGGSVNANTLLLTEAGMMTGILITDLVEKYSFL